MTRRGPKSIKENDRHEIMNYFGLFSDERCQKQVNLKKNHLTSNVILALEALHSHKQTDQFLNNLCIVKSFLNKIN